MLKVLLADDDNLILNRLNEIFLQLPNRAVVVGQASNGLQAVELAKALQPDLILLDVEMPVMNGIEAAKKILAHLPKTKILALSNYDSFQYLRGMMQAGAMDYLLKHELSPALIDQQLRQIKQLCAQQEENLLREQYFSLIARQSFLASLINQTEPDPSYQQIMLRQKEFSGQQFALCILQITNFTTFYPDRKEKLVQSVISICSNIFSSVENGLIAPTDQAEFAVLFRFQDAISQKKMLTQLGEYLALIKGNLKRLLNVDTFAESVLIYDGLSRLAEYYQELRKKVGQQPFNQPEQNPDYLDILDEKALIDSLEQQDMAMAARTLNKLFSSLPDTQKQARLHLSRELLKLLSRYLKRRDLVSELETVQRWEKDTLEKLPAAELPQELLKLFDACIGCTDPELTHCSSHTRNAISYLHRHYFENISLSEVAASLNISPGYLSRIFKSETGSNLVDYLSALRLSKARTLLEDPNLSVQEVAQRVGFNSSNYFIKVFRAQMGETPVQYQNRCRGIDLPTAEE